jgi:streptogramin lyase
VTKILPHGKACPDTNGDGKITTSTGPDDVLDYGQDDCVAWHTETLGDIRGLAAQDLPATASEDMCKAISEGKKDLPTAKDKHYVWISGDHGKIYKLDAKTGKILLTINAPAGGYGMALSGDGRIWTAKNLAFVDTIKCTDEATCNAAPVCTQSCTVTNCPATCDGAVKARIEGISGYGITVDYKKRVWMSAGSSVFVGLVGPTMRYDPNAPAHKRLTAGPHSGPGGIAADAKGWVWAATNSSTTVRIHGDTLQSTTMNAPSKGVAVDSKGRILSVYNTGVHLIQPDAAAKSHTVKKNVVKLKGFAYAYSDMTGVQTMLASDLTGWYRQPFDGCTTSNTEWRTLKWDVEVPAGAWVIFKVRAADDMTALASAPWRIVACVSSPGGTGLASINMLKGKVIEVEARFASKKGKSARIKSFGVVYACDEGIE